MFSLFKKKLPHCDDLFKRYLSPWYPEDKRPTMTRPDMYIIAGYKGKPLNLEEIQYLPEDLLKQTKKRIEVITEAAFQDYKSIIQTDQLSSAVLDAVDKYHDRKQILEIIRQSDPADFANP